MLNYADLASLVRALIGGEHEAVTVTQWAPISPHIADTQYVFVSQRATELFGYQHVTDLEGQYLSQRHTLEDFERGAKLSTARHLGLDIAPNAYTSRILTASGEPRPVYKDTRQLELDGITYWITKLTPTETERPLPDIDLSTAGVTAADLWRFRRQFNIAMLEQMIVNSDKWLQSGMNSSILSQMTEIGKKISMAGGADLGVQSGSVTSGTIVLHPGGSARIPPGRNRHVARPWLHWCQVCAEIWRSDDPEPQQCGRRLCRSFYWRTGVPQDIALESGKARRGRRRTS